MTDLKWLMSPTTNSPV